MAQSHLSNDSIGHKYAESYSGSENINGINLSSTGTIGEVAINGLNISPMGTYLLRLNGVSLNVGISLIETMNGTCLGGFNTVYEVNGIQIGVFNDVEEAKGIQIGVLTNRCSNLKGMQFGLWNINQKRKLPLINWAW